MSTKTTLLDLFPSRSAQVTAGLTIPAASAAGLLPDFLGPLLPGLTSADIVLWRAALFLLVAQLGMLVTLALLVFHYSRKASTWPPERYMKLSMDKRILLAMATISDPTTAKIGREALMSKEAVAYWIAHHRKHGEVAPDLPLRLTDTGHLAAVTV